MGHSKNYALIKGYYDNYKAGKRPQWSLGRVWNVVGKATGITEEEYQEITGFAYPAKEG